MDAAYTYEHAGLTVRIVLDDHPMDPRDRDCLGTLEISAPGYAYTWPECHVPEHIAELHEAGYVVLPLRYSDYGSSGARLYETAADRANAYIYCDPAVEPEADHLTCLRAEVAELDAYYSGEVYGYQIVTPSGAVLDDRWGFTGDAFPAGAYIRQAAGEAAAYQRAELDREASQRAHWAARDVVTVPA